MKRPAKIALLILLGVFIIAQFFRPEKNLAASSSVDDLFVVQDVPEHITALLRSACYDCHSNQTRYPWYSNISPVSWYLSKHVEEGKEALNFSEYGKLEKRKKISALSTICEVVESGSMPLVSFTLIHRDANLDETERKLICDWTEAEADALMQR